MAKRF